MGGDSVGANPEPCMTWKRFFRWFLRAALVCLAGLLCAVGILVYLDWADRAEQWKKSSAGRISVALGWDRKVSFSERARRQPNTLLPFLSHESANVRETAQFYLRSSDSPLNATSLDAIVAEIRDEFWSDRSFMVELLARAGQPGAERLATFYRGKEVIEPAVHLLICQQVASSCCSAELLPALLGIVSDPEVLSQNRCFAADALGLQPKRFRDDDDFGRSAIAANAALREQLSSLPEPIAQSARIALQRIADAPAPETPAAKNDEFAHLSTDGHEAIAALADRDDWERVERAAIALAEREVKEAIPALRQVAAIHWFKQVRHTAQLAINVLDGIEKLSTDQDRHAALRCAIAEFRGVEARRWYDERRDNLAPRFVDRLTEKFRRTIYWRFQPEFDEGEFRRSGRLSRRITSEFFGPRYPRFVYAIDFAGGKLLGINEGEWGGGTVFSRKNDLPLVFNTGCVEGFFRMPFGVLIVCNYDPAGDHGWSYVARQQSDGSLTVTRFKRLPDVTGRTCVLASGDLFLACLGADVVITTAGEIRVATPEEIKATE